MAATTPDDVPRDESGADVGTYCQLVCRILQCSKGRDLLTIYNMCICFALVSVDLGKHGRYSHCKLNKGNMVFTMARMLKMGLEATTACSTRSQSFPGGGPVWISGNACR
eukprot:15085755-Alexandrium_andersonii.AAC.1